MLKTKVNFILFNYFCLEKGIKNITIDDLQLQINKTAEKLSPEINSNLEAQLKKSNTFDKENEQIDQLDINFLYTKEMFSNFLNFNFQELEENNLKLNADVDPNHLIRSENKSHFKELHSTDKFKLTEISFPAKIKKKLNLPSDEIIEREYSKDDLISYLGSSKDLRNSNHKFYLENRKLIRFKDITEKFELKFAEFEKKIQINELKEIQKIMFSDFTEEEKENEINLESDSSQNIEKENYRQEKDTTAFKRKSIDSSHLLSNLSLQEVFDSTNKKLLNRNSNIFGDDTRIELKLDNNIIIEEDSNLNYNTLSHNNLRTNFGGLELDFENDKDDERLDYCLIEEKVKELLVGTNSKKRNSIKKNGFDFFEFTGKVKDALIKNDINQDFIKNTFKENELEGLVFYQMLIISQNNSLNIGQLNPFNKIYFNKC